MDGPSLIVGLGNPGRDYQRTRHNAGFMALDALAERWKLTFGNASGFKAKVAQGEFGGHNVLLCEPQTYMNLSGEAVGALAVYYKVPPNQILVVVDDADLKLGEVRMRASGSSGGHHGLESVERHLGTREYARLRIGIGRQSATVREITGHVLGRFGRDEDAILDKVLDRVVNQVECWLTAGVLKAMNQYNGAVDAPMAKDS